MSAILEGEKCTPDTLIRAEVTTQGIDLEVFHGEKGVVKITLSEEKWSRLVEYITKECEHLQRLKKGGIDG
ncbi:MAG: hypothetical protein HXS54_03675 [Theionarchaea archaeon]|nr:hypothetical protein [Theionarchaea archaeon]